MKRAERTGDRRTRRTQRALRDALFALIAERGYDAIGVGDIAMRADVGRATFYTHYRDKEDLLLSSLQRLANDLVERVEGLDPLAATDLQARQMSLSTAAFQHVAAHRNLYRALFSEREATLVAARLRRHLGGLARRYVIDQMVAGAPTPVDADLLAQYVAGSLLALQAWWLEHDLPTPPEEMGRLFWRLVTPGVNAVLGLHDLPPRRPE